jgi:hypothetical protein
MASGRGCDGARDVAKQYDSLLFLIRIRNGGGRKKGLGIGMHGLFKNHLGWGELNNPSKIHDCNSTAKMLNDQ